ncbi:hypothetical protein KIL84_020164, partial [Mauremys mutica]
MNIMCQGVEEAPSIKNNNYELEVVNEFTYLGSTIAVNLSLEMELSIHIGKGTTRMSRLNKRVWQNNKLAEHTKIYV